MGKLKTTALLSTNESLAALNIFTLFVRRWAIEVPFQEVRVHPGGKPEDASESIASCSDTAAVIELESGTKTPLYRFIGSE